MTVRTIIESDAFRRDLRKAVKRGKNVSKLYGIVERLAKGGTLAPKHKPHPLKGD